MNAVVSLFENEESAPLAERLRPKSLADVAGQSHVLGEGSVLQRAVENNKPLSILLWGPPGCGKTTIAQIYASAFEAHFEKLSAVFSGVADLKRVVSEAIKRREMGERTVLFVDEIHRFNRAQQDAFLPYVESGDIILVGATTENPSFELNAALLSRLQVLTLKSLDDEALETLLKRTEEVLGVSIPVTEKGRQMLKVLAQGDGRYFLGMLETILSAHKKGAEDFDEETLSKLLQRRRAVYDKSAEGHYNLISALHKSIRGSDADAALYYFARMLEGGEAPLFIARRLIRMANEDIGLADPNAILQATAAREAFMSLGAPEGELALAQAVVYLALAPKSNAVYMAYKKVRKEAAKTGHLNPPKVILNAPTKFMEKEGYGEGYIYDHDVEGAFSGQNYFPDEMGRKKYYIPVERGFERDMVKRLNYFNKIREERGT